MNVIKTLTIAKLIAEIVYGIVENIQRYKNTSNSLPTNQISD